MSIFNPLDLLGLIKGADLATAVVSGVVGLLSVILANAIAYLAYRRTHRFEDKTDAVLRKLLKLKWVQRKFGTIQTFVPLEDSKLREALLRAGAIRLTGPEHRNGEQWGFLKDHRSRVFKDKPSDARAR